MNKQDEDRLTEKATQTLDEGVQYLEANICSRLCQGRERALVLASKRQQSRRWLKAPVWGIIAATVMAFYFLKLGPAMENSGFEKVSSHVIEIAQIETVDFDVLTTTDDIEFYQYLEFIEWLEYESDAS